MKIENEMPKRTVTEVLMDKTLTDEQRCAELEAIDPSYHLSGVNVITKEEAAKTVVDIKKGIYNGYGLMYDGVGGLDKVEVVNGKLKYNVGEIQAYLYMGNHEFEIINGEDLKLLN